MVSVGYLAAYSTTSIQAVPEPVVVVVFTALTSVLYMRTCLSFHVEAPPGKSRLRISPSYRPPVLPWDPQTSLTRHPRFVSYFRKYPHLLLYASAYNAIITAAVHEQWMSKAEADYIVTKLRPEAESRASELRAKFNAEKDVARVNDGLEENREAIAERRSEDRRQSLGRGGGRGRNRRP